MQYYQPQRVAALSEVLPKFVAHVQKNDRILLGICTDPAFPVEWRDEARRPLCVVERVKNESTDGASFVARVVSGIGEGRRVVLIPHSLDPCRIFEPTEETYAAWLARTAPKRASDTASDAASDTGAYAELRTLVDALAIRMDVHSREEEKFRKAMHTHMKLNPSEPKVLKGPSPFESDFESEGDED
jgi:hypothetical protein